MGCKPSSTAIQTYQIDSYVQKLLLLGSSSAGKSTLFKQAIHVFGDGYSSEDMMAFKHVIIQNLFHQFLLLIHYCEVLHEEGIENEIVTTKSVEFIKNLSSHTEISLIIADHIEALWNDPAIKSTFSKRSILQLDDSASYFFDNVRRFASIDYVPTYEDIIRVRVKTRGIVEDDSFVCEDPLVGLKRFTLMDVGTQTNSKKWIHHFEKVAAVIFVAAISEYDQSLFIDDQVSLLMESVKFFTQLVESHWLSKIPFVLLFNKVDIFEEKIRLVPFSTCFDNYSGGCDYESCLNYIRNLFISNAPSDRQIKVITTCALNAEQTEKALVEILTYINHFQIIG